MANLCQGNYYNNLNNGNVFNILISNPINYNSSKDKLLIEIFTHINWNNKIHILYY